VRIPGETESAENFHVTRDTNLFQRAAPNTRFLNSQKSRISSKCNFLQFLAFKKANFPRISSESGREIDAIEQFRKHFSSIIRRLEFASNVTFPSSQHSKHILPITSTDRGTQIHFNKQQNRSHPFASASSPARTSHSASPTCGSRSEKALPDQESQPTAECRSTRRLEGERRRKIGSHPTNLSSTPISSRLAHSNSSANPTRPTGSVRRVAIRDALREMGLTNRVQVCRAVGCGEKNDEWLAASPYRVDPGVNAMRPSDPLSRRPGVLGGYQFRCGCACSVVA
jgi:hypothetical protein